MKKFKTLLSFAIALCSVGVLSSGGMEVKNVEAEETRNYTKVTSSVDDLTGYYLIVCEGKNDIYDGNSSGKFHDAGCLVKLAEKTISDGKIEGDYDNYTFTIEKIDDTYYSIRSNSGYYIGNDTTSNKTEYSEDNVYKNEIVINSGNATITGTGGKKLLHNSSSDYYRYYSSGTPIQLYKSNKQYEAPAVVPEAKISVTGNAYTKANGDNITFTSVLKNVEPVPEPVYTSSDDTIARFEGNELVPVKSGKVTATVTYTVGETNYSDSIDVVVYPDNTNPLTVAEALQVCEFTGSTETPYKYTVRGIVSDAVYSSKYNNTDAILNDLYGDDKIVIFRAAANSADDIINGKYYEFIGNLQIFGETREITNCSTSDYKVLTLPLGYAYQDTKVSTQLSFAFEKDAEGTFGGFTNMSLNFRTNLDFSEYTKGIDFTEAGMMIVKGSDVSATYSKKTAEALPEGAIKATQTNYGKEFIVRLEDIPVADWEKQVTVVPYILIEGTYYFGTAGVTSVIETADVYASSDATITMSDESVVNVKDVAAAIADYYIKSLGE